MAFAEDNYENSVIQLFTEMGYRHLYGPEVERDYRSPLFDAELEESIRRINPGVPEDSIQDALFRLRNIEIGEFAQKNEVFMDYLQNGIVARYYENGEERSEIVRLIDYDKPQNNSFIVANQWTYIENSNKRPDVILFIFCRFVVASVAWVSRKSTEKNSLKLKEISSRMELLRSAFFDAIFFLPVSSGGDGNAFPYEE